MGATEGWKSGTENQQRRPLQAANLGHRLLRSSARLGARLGARFCAGFLFRICCSAALLGWVHGSLSTCGGARLGARLGPRLGARVRTRFVFGAQLGARLRAWFGAQFSFGRCCVCFWQKGFWARLR